MRVPSPVVISSSNVCDSPDSMTSRSLSAIARATSGGNSSASVFPTTCCTVLPVARAPVVFIIRQQPSMSLARMGSDVLSTIAFSSPGLRLSFVQPLNGFHALGDIWTEREDVRFPVILDVVAPRLEGVILALRVVHAPLESIRVSGDQASPPVAGPLQVIGMNVVELGLRILTEEPDGGLTCVNERPVGARHADKVKGRLPPVP